MAARTLPIYTALYQALQFAQMARVSAKRPLPQDEIYEEFALIAKAGKPDTGEQFGGDHPLAWVPKHEK